MEVVIHATALTPEVMAIIHQLETIDQTTQTLALTVEDRVILVQPRDIIAFEVSGTKMTVYTVAQSYSIKGQLNRTLDKLNAADFVQVSKNAVLNLNHLEYLEASFSGNMMARLTNNTRILVSRKYLPALKTKLGM